MPDLSRLIKPSCTFDARRSVVLVAAILAISLSPITTFAAEKPAADTSAKPASKPSAGHAKDMAAGLKLFKEKVRPIFMAQCVDCHGGKKLKADFDITTRAKLIAGGGTDDGLVPGNHKASYIYKLMAHTEEPYMPHKKPKVDATTLAVIAKWIDLGAPYDKPLIGDKNAKPKDGKMVVTDEDRKFWSFAPLKQATPPALTSDANKTWAKTAIDHFVLAKLRDKGITPNKQADRRTLIRRAYFDLIGLPPTPEAVDRFVNDTSPKAWEKIIDELLASPHYGERWARHWMDVARFAESHGYEQDYDRKHAYHYRDFLIKAMNADLPYDKFIQWQVAGDELAPNNAEAMKATGFLSAGAFPTQLTEAEFESARYDELDDMAATTSSAFLGLTLGCARCHDHKFDPMPAADYYNFAATFATAIRSEIDVLVDGEDTAKQLAAWEKAKAPLAAAIKAYEQGEMPSRFAAWLKSKAASQSDASAKLTTWQTLTLNAKSHGGATFQRQQDGSYLLTGKSPKNDRWTLQADTAITHLTAIRLEALTHPSMKRNGPGRASNGNFALSDLKLFAHPLNAQGKPAGEAKQVKLVDAIATHQQNTTSLSVAGSIDNNGSSGWAVDFGGIGKDQAAVFHLATPLSNAHGFALRFEMHFNNNVHHSIGRPRLSVTGQAKPAPLKGEASNADALRLAKAIAESGGDPTKLNAKDRAAALGLFKQQDKQWQQLTAAKTAHGAKRPQQQKLRVQVTSEGVPKMKHHANGRGFPHFYPEVYHLKRGDVHQKETVAKPSYIQVLMRDGKTAEHWRVAPPTGWTKTSFRRASLANWLADTKHGGGHLAARVAVNRLWQHHFGTGIVATPNDFGFTGERPSHPMLLDYLANDLIQHGWKVKRLHKLIMTSAVYTQSSEHDRSKMSVDPNNRLLWRFGPRRLEGEAIRDSLLAVSGVLDRKMYGPGTLNESMTRRSIYFFIKRSKLVPTMMLFDWPEHLVSIGARSNTTIAPQALLFMNSPQVRRYADSFAKQLTDKSKPSVEAAITEAYRIALQRKPDSSELAIAKAFVEQQTASHGGNQHAALTDLCQTLMSLNEFLFVE